MSMGDSSAKTRIWVSVTNDITNDNRVQKTCSSLGIYGLDVCLVGIKRRNSKIFHKNNWTIRYIKPILLRNALFYTEINIRLFFFLLFHRADILWANDLDTLLPNFLISKIKRIPLIFDSHEMFPYVAELKEGSFQQMVWLKIEKFLVPKMKYVFTVCEPIKDYFRDNYGIEACVVRNIPFSKDISPKCDLQAKEENITKNYGKYIIWQGSVNIDRGLEELVEAMQWIDCNLVILGRGDIDEKLQHEIKHYHLEEKIFMLGRKSFDEMMSFTRGAIIGLSIDKPTNRNYAISLPNKIFEYISALTPMLCTPLVEIKKIVDECNVGELLPINYTPKILAQRINNLIHDEQRLNDFKQNCSSARQHLSWENEQQEIFKLLDKI